MSLWGRTESKCTDRIRNDEVLIRRRKKPGVDDKREEKYIGFVLQRIVEGSSIRKRDTGYSGPQMEDMSEIYRKRRRIRVRWRVSSVVFTAVKFVRK